MIIVGPGPYRILAPSISRLAGMIPVYSKPFGHRCDIPVSHHYLIHLPKTNHLLGRSPDRRKEYSTEQYNEWYFHFCFNCALLIISRSIRLMMPAKVNQTCTSKLAFIMVRIAFFITYSHC